MWLNIAHCTQLSIASVLCSLSSPRRLQGRHCALHRPMIASSALLGALLFQLHLSPASSYATYAGNRYYSEGGTAPGIGPYYTEAFTWQGTGVAAPTEVWNVDSGLGLGVLSCYYAVMAHVQCNKDYFMYNARRDGNCGCKGSSTSVTVRALATSDYYIIHAKISFAYWKPGFVVQDVPTVFIMLITMANGLSDPAPLVLTRTLTVSADLSIFDLSRNPAVSLHKWPLSVPPVDSGLTYSTATSADGKNLYLTRTAGSLGAGVYLLTVTDYLVPALPASAVSVNVQVRATEEQISPIHRMDVIAHPSIVRTSDDDSLNAETAVSTLKINTTTVHPIYSATYKVNGTWGTTFKLVSNKAIFHPNKTTGLTVTGLSFLSYTTSSDGTTLSGTFNADVAAGTTYILSFHSSMLANIPNDAGECLMSMTITQSTVDIPFFANKDGYGLIEGVATLHADPVAKFGDIVRHFELPPQQLTDLVRAPDLTIQGSVFEGGGPWEQWFDRLVLTLVDQDRFLEIKMRKNLHEVNYSMVPRELLKTLDISIGHGAPDAPHSVSRFRSLSETIPHAFLGHYIGFRKVMRHHTMAHTTIGMLPRECVDIAGEYLHVYICSAPASEYYGHQRDLSIKYAHLDMLFIQVRDFKLLSGLLPELWGLQPMSEKTKSYIRTDEALASKADAIAFATKASDAAWAGGPQIEDLEERCAQNWTNDTQKITI